MKEFKAHNLPYYEEINARFDFKSKPQNRKKNKHQKFRKFTSDFIQISIHKCIVHINAMQAF